MRRSPLPTTLAPLALLFLVAACVQLGAEREPATPQRPTLSADTNTTAPGTFEVEAGLFVDPSDAVDTPLALKYGLGPALEGFIGFSPYVHVDGEGGSDDGDGIGDLALGMRHRVREQEGGVPSLAYQLTVQLATGDEDEGISSGATDFFAAAIAMLQQDALTWTGFYQLGVLGERNASSGTLEHDVALAVGLPIHGPWGGFVELAGIYLPEEEIEFGLATLGATFARVPWRVLDVALTLGIGDDGPDAQLSVGVTQNLGRARARTRAP